MSRGPPVWAAALGPRLTSRTRVLWAPGGPLMVVVAVYSGGAAGAGPTPPASPGGVQLGFGGAGLSPISIARLGGHAL